MISPATSANDAKNDIKGTLSDTGDALADSANKAGRKVRAYIDGANEQIGAAADKVTAEIRSNPIRSSVIALSVGYIVGMLSRR